MIGDKIRSERMSQDITQRELAQKTGINVSVLNRIENGDRSARDDEIKIISDVLGISADYLIGRTHNKTVSPPNTTRRIDIFGSVPAGIPIEAIQEVEDWEDIDLSQAPFSAHKDYIGLRVKGDSMYPKYLEGDYIIVEINPQPESGKDCVVYVNGYDATLKTVVKNNYVDDRGNIKTSYTLIPINPKYETKTYAENDEPIVILGQVVQVRRNI